MKKIITGFFMSWGMFCTIPCPNKVWDDESRSFSVVFLPVIGLIIGIIWAVIAFLLHLISCPAILTAALLTVIPYLLSGFMHLDGFMDCCDAMLSRRTLEERQRILKDSHTGAFAVICLCILMLITFSLFASTKTTFSVWSLIFIPAAARIPSAICVLCLTPMSTSQYAKAEHPKMCRIAAYALLVIICVLDALIFGVHGIGAAAAVISGFAAVLYARGNLGGMSGDISGFGITIAECIGIAFTVLI